MKAKIFGIIVGVLLIATVFPLSNSSAQVKENINSETKDILTENIPYLTFNTLPEDYTYFQEKYTKEMTLNRGWVWMQSYSNYAPNGTPDFFQKQDNWKSIRDGGNGIAESTAIDDDIQITEVGEPVDPYYFGAVVGPGPNCALSSIAEGDDTEMWNFCVAVSTADCFWWLDTKYGNPDGIVGDGEDEFSLVVDYGAGDDHSDYNAFLLIMEVANALNITHTLGVAPVDWIAAIDQWFVDAGLGYLFETHYYTVPTFDFIAGEIEKGRCVLLVVYFCNDVSGTCIPVANHVVVVAGIDQDELQIALCDPWFDITTPGLPSHNDPQYVSHDIYDVLIGSPCPNYPEIEWWLPDFWPYYDYSVVYEALIINTTNEPPELPIITGKANGKAGKEYTYSFNAMDQDADDVKYYIDWGDGNIEETGFFSSGTDVDVKHIWTEKGTYNITAKAQDTNGFYSMRTTIEVSMPLVNQYNPMHQFMSWIFKYFPNAFAFLRWIFEL